MTCSSACCHLPNRRSDHEKSFSCRDYRNPVERRGGRSVGWWGMVVVIATEGTIFLGLLSTYFFLRASSPRWPPAGVELPQLPLIIVFTVVPSVARA